MKPEEFSIGNLIQIKMYQCDKSEPHEIAEILKHTITDVSGLSFRYSEIHPILLTEAVLVNSGLLKNDYENVILIDDFYTLRYFDFDKYHDKSGWYLYVNYVEYETSTVIVYVHEFQDLYFALKRKEINISL